MVKRYHIYIGFAIFAILLIIGSFWDLTIAKNLFFPNNGFGLTISAFGTLPGYIALSFLGGIAINYKLQFDKYKGFVKFIMIGLGCFCFGFGIYDFGTGIFGENGFYNPSMHWLGVLIAVLLLTPFFIIGLFEAKKVTSPYAWIYLIIMALVTFFALLICCTFGLKYIMHRPRFRTVVVDNESLYHNWWEPFKEYKDYLDTYSKEEFKSFPSGHACGTALLMMVSAYMPLFYSKFKKHQILLYYLSLAYNLLVCYSRVSLGAHFLSDIAMGGLLFMFFFMIGNEIIITKFLKKDPTQLPQTF